MNKIYTYLILAGIVILSVSQIYLWKDQMQLWHQLNLHMMLDGSKSVSYTHLTLPTILLV